VVFIVNEITDLDEYNLYCFKKGLRGKKFLLIICSHHYFEKEIHNDNEYYQTFHYQLYNPKELFCQYLYACLASPAIRPYLPFQVLKLITDMNYYSLSYHESCRRFQFCVERSLMLYRKERVFVEFDKLVNAIEFALMK
jgi:hypothetical protein